MAWTAPRTWSNGGVVTDTQLNTDIRDNLSYLKDSPVFDGSPRINGTGLGIGVTPTVPLDVSAASCVANFLTTSNANGSIFQLRNNTGGSTLLGAFNFLNSAGSARGQLAYYTSDALTMNVAGAEKVRLTATGLGVGTTPQGALHTYGTCSGMMKWEFDGLDGTVRTIIPNGTGDAAFGLRVWSFAVHNSTTIQGAEVGGTMYAPGVGNIPIFSSGGNEAKLNYAADGSLTVSRTAGTGTYKVSLFLLWL